MFQRQGTQPSLAYKSNQEPEKFPGKISVMNKEKVYFSLILYM